MRKQSEYQKRPIEILISKVASVERLTGWCLGVSLSSSIEVLGAGRPGGAREGRLLGFGVTGIAFLGGMLIGDWIASTTGKLGQFVSVEDILMRSRGQRRIWPPCPARK